MPPRFPTWQPPSKIDGVRTLELATRLPRHLAPSQTRPHLPPCAEPVPMSALPESVEGRRMANLKPFAPLSRSPSDPTSIAVNVPG